MKDLVKHIETSPFFTPSLEMPSIKRHVFVCAIFLAIFNFLCYIVKPVTYSIPFDNSTLIVRNSSNLPQPFYVFPKYPLLPDSHLILLYNSDGGPRNINVTQRGTELNPFFKFRCKVSEFKIQFFPPQGENHITLTARKRQFSILAFSIKMVFLLTNLLCLVYSIYNPLTFPSVPLNIFAVLYCLHRLELFYIGTKFESIVITSFYIFFVIYGLLQSNMLFSCMNWVHYIILPMSSLCGILFLLFMINPEYGSLAFLSWLILLCFSSIFILKGKTILHPVLISLHFGWFCAVTGGIVLSAIYRTSSNILTRSLLPQSLDISIISVFIIFQIIFIMGEPFKANPDLSLGSVARQHKIDQLLDILVARETEELRTTAFQ